MLNLLRWLTSWTVRHILIFGIIVAAMVAFIQVKAAFDRVPALQSNVEALETQRRLFNAEAAALRSWAGAKVSEISRAEKGALLSRLATLQAELADPANRRASRADFYREVLIEGPVDAVARDLRAAFAQQLRQREAAAIESRLAMMVRRDTLILSDQRRRQAVARIAAVDREIAAIERRRFINTPVIRRVTGGPQLDAYRRERDGLVRQQAELERAQQQAQAAFDTAREQYGVLLVRLREARPAEHLDERVAQLREELAQDWTFRVWDAVRPVLAWALWVLALLIVVPPLVKAFWFYLIAPIAARLAPIRIRPELGGDVGWASPRVAGAGAPSGSAVSREVLLRSGDELLIKPEYLHSSVTDARIDSRLVLSRHLFFGSLATGLVNLTRIRVDREATVAVSATRDMIDEVGLIEIAEGSALVFQPRNLIGVIQRGDRPLRIDKAWRAGHLSSWLTLRLRHLVFHGPCALVVKGARGIAMEPATGGRRIAGAATMGWSANLAWSVRRSETFHAYLTGKQSLFNDGFDGSQGKVVYEQMPRAGLKGGWWARGLDGVGDGLLKIVGL